MGGLPVSGGLDEEPGVPPRRLVQLAEHSVQLAGHTVQCTRRGSEGTGPADRPLDRPFALSLAPPAAPLPRGHWHPSGRPSTTAHATASWTARRSARYFAVSRVGFTRFVSSTTNRSSSGSIQIEVPVKPVWPKASSVRNRPAEEPSLGVSQPSARLDAGPARRTKRATRAGSRTRGSTSPGGTTSP